MRDYRKKFGALWPDLFSSWLFRTTSPQNLLGFQARLLTNDCTLCKITRSKATFTSAQTSSQCSYWWTLAPTGPGWPAGCASIVRIQQIHLMSETPPHLLSTTSYWIKLTEKARSTATWATTSSAWSQRNVPTTFHFFLSEWSKTCHLSME